MINKLLLSFILVMVLVAGVHADFSFDNVKEYDTEKREVTITDNYGFGGELVKARLVSPLQNEVPNGKNILVAEIEFTQLERSEDKADVFNTIDFYDNKQSQLKIVRPFTYKYRVQVGTKEVPHYDTLVKCEEIYDDTFKETKTSCFYDVSHYTTEPLYNWVEFTSLNELPAGTVYIGIFTDVKDGDFVEWVPTFFGYKVQEWASWLSHLNTNLQVYYNMNNSVDSIDGEYNLTSAGSPTHSANNSKIAVGAYFRGTSDGYVTNTSEIFDFYQANKTINYWVNLTQYNTGVGNDYHLRANLGTGFSSGTYSDGDLYVVLCSAEIRLNTNWGLKEYHMVTYTKNDTGGAVYVDGTVQQHCAGLGSSAGATILQFAKRDSSAYLYGNIDEFGLWGRALNASEIGTDLWNGGAGITYGATGTPSTALSISVSQTAPANASSTVSSTSAFNATITISGTGANHTNQTLRIWNSVGALFYSNFTTTGGTTTSLQINDSVTGMTDGAYTWNVYACAINDTSTRCADGVSNFTRYVDTTSPIVTLNYPNSTTELQTFSLPLNVTNINSTAVDAVALSTCWTTTSESDTNTTFNCNTLTSRTYATSGVKTLTAWANDTTAHLNSSTKTFLINGLNATWNFTNPALASEPYNIVLRLVADNITTLTANISYNGVFYPTNVSYNFSTAYINATITSPASSGLYVIFANFTLNGQNRVTPNTNQTVQSVAPMTIVSNPASCQNVSANFTLYDEENLSWIQGDIDYNFKYGFSNNTQYSVYGSITNVSSIYACINSSTSPNYTIGYGELQYRNSVHVDRRYYVFENTQFTEQARNYSIYDLLTTSQTSFKIEVEDTYLNPYEEVYTALLRWYPAINEYKVVDMGLTDENGDTLFHVVSEDVDYRIGVYEQNGTILKLVDPLRFICLVNPCTFTIRISPDERDFISLLTLDYALDYNETTRIWTLVFSDRTQQTTLMNLTVYKKGITDVVVCSSTQSATSGTITCNTTGYDGTLEARVYRSASPPVYLSNLLISTVSNSFTNGSTWVLWLVFILAIPIMLVFGVMSPEFALIGVIVAIIPAYFLGIINMAVMGGLIGVVIAVGVAITWSRR